MQKLGPQPRKHFFEEVNFDMLNPIQQGKGGVTKFQTYLTYFQLNIMQPKVLGSWVRGPAMEQLSNFGTFEIHLC